MELDQIMHMQTRSMLGLLLLNLQHSYGPCLNFISTQYLVSELMEFLSNFACALTLTRSRFSFFTRQFLQIYNMVMALGYCQNFL